MLTTAIFSLDLLFINYNICILFRKVIAAQYMKIFLRRAKPEPYRFT